MLNSKVHFFDAKNLPLAKDVEVPARATPGLYFWVTVKGWSRESLKKFLETLGSESGSGIGYYLRVQPWSPGCKRA